MMDLLEDLRSFFFFFLNRYQALLEQHFCFEGKRKIPPPFIPSAFLHFNTVVLLRQDNSVPHNLYTKTRPCKTVLACLSLQPTSSPTVTSYLLLQMYEVLFLNCRYSASKCCTKLGYPS